MADRLPLGRQFMIWCHSNPGGEQRGLGEIHKYTHNNNKIHRQQYTNTLVWQQYKNTLTTVLKYTDNSTQIHWQQYTNTLTGIHKYTDNNTQKHWQQYTNTLTTIHKYTANNTQIHSQLDINTQVRTHYIIVLFVCYGTDRKWKLERCPSFIDVGVQCTMGWYPSKSGLQYWS